MPRKLERALSPRKVQTAGPGMWADGGGLYLQVTEAKNGGTNRSWIFRYGTTGPNGKTRYRDFGLGSVATFGLAEARERARALRQKRYDGIDPVEERKAARRVVAPKVVLFDEEADAWLDAHAAEWKPTYRRAQAQRLQDHVHPVIGKLPVGDVTVRHVTDILNAIWKTHPNTARLVRIEIESILDAAKVKGHRTGDNPAAWAGNLKHVFGKPTELRKAKRAAEGKGAHHPALPYGQIGAFMTELRALDGDVRSWALQFCILTATRSNETIFATWDEIDIEARSWTIASTRMKAGREHRIPLADAAVAVLKKAATVRIDERVFPGVGSTALLELLRRRMKRKDISVHGFRACFRTWAGDCTAVPREICEAALAHYATGTEAAYARGDLFKRRAKLMDSWGAFCAKPVVTEGKVLQLRKAAAR